MKNHHCLPLFTALPALTVFALAGCSAKENYTATALPPANQQNATAPAEAKPVVAPSAAKPGDTPPAALFAHTAQWSDIKDQTFEGRGAFIAGLKQLQARVDEQVTELGTRRAALPSGTSKQDWDIAMKEMNDSRSYLKSTGEELSTATAETWQQMTEKVGQAWVRTQAAYSMVRASTTAG